MTKNDFLEQLSHKLKVLPESEQQDALEYYRGYISDADDEAAAIRALGSPGEVAATILANYVSLKPTARGYASEQEARRPRLKAAYIAIIAIFAVPIGIPLAATAFGLIVALLSIVFSVFVTGFALLVAGLVSLVMSPIAFFTDFWFGLFHLGLGVAALGFGILVLKGGIKLVGSGFPAIMRLVRGRRGRREGEMDGAPVSHMHHDPQRQEPYHHFGSTATAESTTDSSKFGDPQYSNSAPWSHTSHAPVTRRRAWRLPSVGVAIFLILLGGLMHGAAWMQGARGGSFVWRDGRIEVEVAQNIAHAGQVSELPIGSSGNRSENFHEVHIIATNRNVVILPSDTVRAAYTGTSNVNIGIEDGVLTIAQRQTGTQVFNVMDLDFSPGRSNEIRLYLPPEFFAYQDGLVSVRTTNGNIRVEGDFTNLMASSTSGNITVANNNNYVSSMTLLATTGRISVDNMNTIASLEVTATTGRTTIRNFTGTLDAATIRSTTGNIAIYNIGGMDTITATATTGNIEVRNISSEMESVNLRTTTGRQNIYGIPHVRQLNTASTTGRVHMDDIGWANLGIVTTTGRVDVTQGRAICLYGRDTSTQLSATTGNISLQLAGARDDFRLGLTSSSGRVSTDGTRISERGSIELGAGTSPIYIRTTSGNITINFVG